MKNLILFLPILFLECILGTNNDHVKDNKGYATGEEFGQWKYADTTLVYYVGDVQIPAGQQLEVLVDLRSGFGKEQCNNQRGKISVYGLLKMELCNINNSDAKNKYDDMRWDGIFVGKGGKVEMKKVGVSNFVPEIGCDSGMFSIDSSQVSSCKIVARNHSAINIINSNVWRFNLSPDFYPGDTWGPAEYEGKIIADCDSTSIILFENCSFDRTTSWGEYVFVEIISSGQKKPTIINCHNTPIVR